MTVSLPTDFTLRQSQALQISHLYEEQEEAEKNKGCGFIWGIIFFILGIIFFLWFQLEVETFLTTQCLLMQVSALKI